MASIQTGGPDGVTLHGIELVRRYAGDRDPAGLRHGKGRYEFPNPAYTYEGDFRRGRKHGVGTFTTPTEVATSASSSTTRSPAGASARGATAERTSARSPWAR